MTTGIHLDAGIAKFTVDLSEFVSAAKDLANAAIGANEKEQARAAIKAMIDEVRQTYDTIVDTLTPLYGIDNAEHFAQQFGGILVTFKGIYLRRSDTARAHCHRVREFFDALQQRRSWMEHIPIANRSFLRLKKICEQWFFNDIDLFYQMDRFFVNLNDFMDNIADLNRKDRNEAFPTMLAALREAEGNFKEMQKQLSALDNLGVRIG
jgi:hypothetical protein